MQNPESRLRKADEFTGVASNARVSRDVRIGGTHLNYFIRFKTAAGATASQADVEGEVSSITVRVDGEIKIEADSDWLYSLGNYYRGGKGYSKTAGILPVPLTPIEYELFDEKLVYAWGTENLTNINVEIELGTLTNIAAAELWVESVPIKRQFGPHRQIRLLNRAFSNTGKEEITELPTFADNVAYKSIHVELAGTSTITSVKSTLNDVRIYDEPNVAIINAIEKSLGRQISALDYLTIPFDLGHNPTAFLPMAGVRDWRHEIEWATAAPTNYKVQIETIHGLTIAAAPAAA